MGPSAVSLSPPHVRAWPIEARDRSSASVRHCRCDRILGARLHASNGCLLAAHTAARAGSSLTHDAATADSPHRINVNAERWHERLLFPRWRRSQPRRLRVFCCMAVLADGSSTPACSRGGTQEYSLCGMAMLADGNSRTPRVQPPGK